MFSCNMFCLKIEVLENKLCDGFVHWLLINQDFLLSWLICKFSMDCESDNDYDNNDLLG